MIALKQIVFLLVFLLYTLFPLPFILSTTPTFSPGWQLLLQLHRVVVRTFRILLASGGNNPAGHSGCDIPRAQTPAGTDEWRERGLYVSP